MAALSGPAARRPDQRGLAGPAESPARQEGPAAGRQEAGAAGGPAAGPGGGPRWTMLPGASTALNRDHAADQPAGVSGHCSRGWFGGPPAGQTA